MRWRTTEEHTENTGYKWGGGMIVSNGQVVMQGLRKEDRNCIQNPAALLWLIDEVGFLPLFGNGIPGFSVEEHTATSAWWSGNPKKDPWYWREELAAEGRVAYGKLFGKKAGFISRRWYPFFAVYRRDGYDFDSRYEEGLASHKCKTIMSLVEQNDTLSSRDIKARGGFGKGGQTGYETAVTTLQMQTYLTVRGFERKRNRRGEVYGWPAGVFSTSEALYGPEHVHSQYHLPPQKALEIILAHMKKLYPGLPRAAYLKELV